jgi:hypothetical protein
MICINDVHMEEEDFRKYRDMVNDAFEKHFPEISRFERH